MAKLKVMIGYPSPGMTDFGFEQDKLNLIMHNWLDYDLHVRNSVSSRITMNRNNIVKDAIDAGLKGDDRILWIDADTKFPHSGLKALIAHDKDVVCATTSRRVGEDRSPACYPMDIGSIQPFQQLVPMRIMGLPFMLTKMSVFEKLRAPYFAEPPRWMMDEIYGADATGYQYQERDQDVMPEDEYFCWQLRKAGFEILCDMQLSMQIGHVGRTVYYIKNPLPSGQGDIAFESNIDFALGQKQGRTEDQIGE